MKKIKFIKELVAEGKIRLVSPSNEVSAAYAKKSLNSLKASKLLLNQSLLEEATSMLYYAMYNKVMSLFFLVGIKCENHNASIILFKGLFKLDNFLLSFAKQERVDKQYQKSRCPDKEKACLYFEQTFLFTKFYLSVRNILVLYNWLNVSPCE
jgi:uncharacterized protein (UPF0332 family)